MRTLFTPQYHQLRKAVVMIMSMVVTMIASGQFQVVHDAPNTTTTPTIRTIILDDGKILTYQWDGGHILRKYTTQGTLEWTRTFELPNYTWVSGAGIIAMERDGAGGVIIFRYAGTTMVFDGLTTLYYQILKVNADGEITQSVEFNKEYEHNSNMTFRTLDASKGPDGSMVAIITYNDGI